MRLFDLLPVAAVIDKKYFAVHGGISPNFNKVEEIQQIDRFK
jgi:diadenosine tetraphosphatase ApaH/serine/threonine PP2A family protein phosphatase